MDIERIAPQKFFDELARRLDPLAFDNDDERDREHRHRIAYSRIRVAMEAYMRERQAVGDSDAWRLYEVE